MADDVLDSTHELAELHVPESQEADAAAAVAAAATAATAAAASAAVQVAVTASATVLDRCAYKLHKRRM